MLICSTCPRARGSSLQPSTLEASILCLHIEIIAFVEFPQIYTLLCDSKSRRLGVAMAKTSGGAGGKQEVDAMRDALEALDGLQQEEHRRTLNWLAEKLGLGALSGTPAAVKTPGAPGSGSGSPAAPVAGQTPKVFMTAKRAKTVQERIACLAYYLTHERNMPTFKTKELTKLNGDAAQPKISNPAFFVRNAANAQYLALAGGGRKQITARGEALVAALPDREAVKKALEDNPLSGRRGRGGKRNKKKAVK